MNFLTGLITLPLGRWTMPNSYDFVFFILIRLLGSVANLLLTQLYKLAEVTLTTPLKYLHYMTNLNLNYLSHN